MATAKKNRVRSISKAVRSTVESLEGRVHLAAGQYDWSWNAGQGWGEYQYANVFGGIHIPPPVFNPSNVTYTAEGNSWNGTEADILNDPQTIIHDATIDAGGRLIVVGEQTAHHLYTRGNATYDYYDRDFFVARIRNDGTIDAMVTPNMGPDGLGNFGLGNDVGTDEPYPATSRTMLDERAFATFVEPQYLPDGVTLNPNRGMIVAIGRQGDPGNIGGLNTIVIGRYTFTSVSQGRNLAAWMPTGMGNWGAFSVTDAAIQAVGNQWKYVVSGSRWDPVRGQNFALWRFNTDGTLDTTFGTGGVIETSFQNSSDDEITGIAIQKDGRIVVTGYADDTTWSDQSSGAHVRMLVGRYTADGQVDTTYGVNGFTEIASFGLKNARGNAIMLQADGRAVVGGTFDQFANVSAADGTSYDTGVVVRLSTTGQVDTTFGVRGRLLINDVSGLNRSWRVTRLAEQSDGKIVVSGVVGDSMDLVRLSANGQLDLAYGGNNNAHANMPGLPTGLRASRMTNIEGYNDDLPVLTLAKGEDSDKAYLIGNFESTGAPMFGPYVVARIQTDNTPPTAVVQADNVDLTSNGATSYSFVVTYNDNVGVDWETIGANDVYIVGPGNVLINPASFTVLGVRTIVGDPDGGGSNDFRQIVVQYTITPPGGSWDAADNGNYIIRLRKDAVKDVEGASVPTLAGPDGLTGTNYMELGNFVVGIFPPDVTPPTAVAPGLQTNLTVGGRLVYRFDVTFSETGGTNPGENVAVASLTNDRVITVFGPNGYMQNARFVRVNDATDGTPRTATYEIDAPGGMWDPTDSGTYFFNINANVVSDDYVSPNYIQATELGRLQVEILPDHDVRPVASRVDGIAPYNPVSNQTLTSKQNLINFFVKYEVSSYADPASVLDRNTILNNNNAIQVTSNLPVFSRLAQFVGIVDSDVNDKWIVVQYSITPADGSWDQIDSGTYSVNLLPNQIADKNDPTYPPSFVPATPLGSITVQIVDQFNPTYQATLPLPSPVAQSTTYSLTVTYTDDMAIDPATIDTNDIVISRTGGGPLVVLSPLGVVTSVTPAGVQAVYTFSAPNGLWNFFANGTYTVVLKANQVFDTAGKPVVADPLLPAVQDITIGNFSLAIPDSAVPTVDDLTPPVQPPPIQATTYDVTVIYRDDNVIDLSSITNSNIELRATIAGSPVVLTPLLASPPTISAAIAGQPVAVTYHFGAPSLGMLGAPAVWNYLANGTWSINILPNQVKDGAGKFVAARTIGQFVFTDNAVQAAELFPIAVPVWGNGVFSVQVQYTDDFAVDVNTISAEDIMVERTDGASFLSLQSAGAPTYVVTNPGLVVATYTFLPPGGWWEGRDNGTYTIRLTNDPADPDGAGPQTFYGVADNNGLRAAAQDLAIFQLSIVPDVLNPTASVTLAPTITNEGVSSYVFDLSYADLRAAGTAGAIELSTVLDGSVNVDVQVIGPTGTVYNATLAAIQPGVVTNISPLAASYRITAQGGDFTAADNGIYTIVMVADSVTDVSGNAVAPGIIGSFRIQIPDNEPPTASLENLQPPVEGSATYSVTVVYDDPSGVDLTSINAADLVISRSGASPITLASAGAPVIQPQDLGNTQVKAIYTFNAPGGTWDYLDVGTYTITLVASEVRDSSGFAAPGQELGTFDFNVQNLPPVVTAVATPVVSGPGFVTVTLTMTDDIAINMGSVDVDDIQVTRVSGGSAITLELVDPPNVAFNVPNQTNGTPRTATWTFKAPGGYWESNDNGVYQITLRNGGDGIFDVLGQEAVGGAIGSFQVNFAIDNVLPTATVVSAPPITTLNNSTYLLQVQYADNVAVDFNTIGQGTDIQVVSPSGIRYDATMVPPSPTAFAPTITVSYSIDKGSNFTFADNGTWTIQMMPARVMDVSGNAVAGGVIGTFTVNVPNIMPPTITNVVIGPVVNLADSNLITVTYSSLNSPLDMASIVDNNNVLRVTGPNGFSQFATYDSAPDTSDGLVRTVVYRLDAPGGQWDFADNGTYFVSVAPGNGVQNLAGLTLTPGIVKTFAVSLPSVTVQGQTLTIIGTDTADMIEVIGLNMTDGNPGNDQIKVIANNSAYFFDRALISGISIDVGAGNDTVKIDPGVPFAAEVRGRQGNDSIWGGDLNDSLYGGTGDDYIAGGAGSDYISGADGNDRLVGGAGADTIFGGTGNDFISGGKANDALYGDAGNDTLEGNLGNNNLYGGDGNDVFLARNGLTDRVDGGAGFNSAQVDASDILIDIQSLLA